MLEAQMDVDRFGRDEGEVGGSAPDGQVVADEPPARSDPLDRLGDGPSTIARSRSAAARIPSG